jgi:hypothetical protein
MAQSVIVQLDITQESRALTDDEHTLRDKLKQRVLGLVVLKRLHKRQCSHIANPKLGDANTRFFQLKVNSRRRKNFSSKLKAGSGWATTHEDKASITQLHFENTLGPPTDRDLDFNWDILQRPPIDLAAIDADFTEEEVERALRLMPKDKASGPDGFTINFFVKCWGTIKGELMSLIHSFHNRSYNFSTS